MRLRRGINWKFVCKVVWVLLSLSILQMGLRTCLDDPYLCANAENEMLPSMFLLSFPAGLVAFLFVYPFVESGTPLNYSALWLFMFVAGFVQWFILIPNLGGPRLITLGLSTPRDLTEADLNVIEPRPARQTRSRRRTRRSIPAYDRNGLTPLERAIKTRRGRN